MFASRNPAWALTGGFVFQDHVWITTNHFVRVHKDEFDEMLCKLDSTEFARSFEQGPFLPQGIHPIIPSHQYDEDVLATGDSVTAGVTRDSLLRSLSPCTTLSLHHSLTPASASRLPLDACTRHAKASAKPHTHTKRGVSLKSNSASSLNVDVSMRWQKSSVVCTAHV